jgi:hypothetical protein
MTLHPGTRLGPYEIQSALGAGGMGLGILSIFDMQFEHFNDRRPRRSWH